MLWPRPLRTCARPRLAVSTSRTSPIAAHGSPTDDTHTPTVYWPTDMPVHPSRTLTLDSPWTRCVQLAQRAPDGFDTSPQLIAQHTRPKPRLRTGHHRRRRRPPSSHAPPPAPSSTAGITTCSACDRHICSSGRAGSRRSPKPRCACRRHPALLPTAVPMPATAPPCTAARRQLARRLTAHVATAACPTSSAALTRPRTASCRRVQVVRHRVEQLLDECCILQGRAERRVVRPHASKPLVRGSPFRNAIQAIKAIFLFWC